MNVTELLTSPTLNFWLHFNLRGWSWNGWFWFITGKSETIKSTLKLSTWHHVRALIHCDLWIYLKQLHVFFPWVAHKKGEEKSWRQRVDKWQTGSSPNFCIHFFFIALVVRNFFFSCANSFSEYFRTRKPYLCALYNDLVLLSLTSLLLHTQQLFLQVFTIKIPYISRVRGGKKKHSVVANRKTALQNVLEWFSPRLKIDAGDGCCRYAWLCRFFPLLLFKSRKTNVVKNDDIPIPNRKPRNVCLT